MNKIFFLLLVVSNICFAIDDLKKISLQEVASVLNQKNKQVMILDANVESTRRSVGKVPGAYLLTSSSEYDVAAVLPKDKKMAIIFYCANQECTASHTAAKRAMAAGYVNVAVMVDGIYGWQKAKLPLESVITSGDSISPKDAFSMQQAKSAIIVDVREDEERHLIIPGSLWIPMTDARKEEKWNQFVMQLPKDKTIIFYCAAGVRARAVANKLMDQGYQTAFFNGPDQWKSFGLPVLESK